MRPPVSASKIKDYLNYSDEAGNKMLDDAIVLGDLTTELGHRLEEEKPKITTDDLDDMLDDILG